MRLSGGSTERNGKWCRQDQYVDARLGIPPTASRRLAMTPLRQRMLHDMQIRNLADNTQKSYLIQVSSFARHFRRSPEGLGPEEIRAWIIHLTNERKLAPASVQLAVGALRFLYRIT